jgi:hypothetical protein
MFIEVSLILAGVDRNAPLITHKESLHPDDASILAYIVFLFNAKIGQRSSKLPGTVAFRKHFSNKLPAPRLKMLWQASHAAPDEKSIRKFRISSL